MKEARNVAISKASDQSNAVSIISGSDYGWFYGALSILAFVAAFFLIFAIFGVANGVSK